MDTLLEQKIIDKFKKDCSLFSSDNEYRKNLALALGLNKDEYFLLRPIIGENELKSIVENLNEKNFMPGERLDLTKVDSHNDKYLKTGEFKANLHIHTLHSDGRLTIKDYLNQAKKLADENYQKNNADMPLVLALTDHDCIDGAKEIAIELAKNPTDYNNLRLVLGVELSTITNQFKNLKKPLLIHTHMFCINPFDEKLNHFINKKRDLKLNLAKETVKKLNLELKEILNKYNIVLTLDEAALIHELVTKGQDEVYIPMKKYVGGKLLFTHYILKLKEKLLTYGISETNLSYEKPYTQYKYMFKDGGGYVNNYKKALNLYLSDFIYDKTKIKVDFSNILSVANKEIEAAIEKAQLIYAQAHPTLTTMPEAFDGFEDTLKLLSNQPFGMFSIAHPGRTIVKDADTDLYSLFENMFSSFKEFAGKKAFSYEGYYQSYSGTKYQQYIDPITKAAEKYNLLKVGGLDTHGESITCRGGNP